jgi:hypothetical protein
LDVQIVCFLRDPEIRAFSLEVQIPVRILKRNQSVSDASFAIANSLKLL